MKKIGIYGGTFDPVHKGHIEFALVAAKAGKLEAVFFLPESQPRSKDKVTLLSQRLVMLKLALKAYPQFKVLNLPQGQFSVKRTLPALQAKFPAAQLVFLAGSDVARTMPSWPGVEKLFSSAGLIVGLRQVDSQLTLEQALGEAQAMFITSPEADLSSAKIRAKPFSLGLEPSVQEFIKQHGLYK